jgi:predicted  nucleic acid-binding Zn-ribbon protein
MFSEWIFSDASKPLWLQNTEMTTPNIENLAGQIAGINTRLDSAVRATLEERERMDDRFEKTLERLHKRLDEALDLKQEIATHSHRIAALEKVMWFAATSGVAGLVGALWSFVRQGLN